MDQVLTLTLLLASIVVFVGGIIKGAVAVGFPLFTTPLLAALYGPKLAVVLIVLPVVILNVVMLATRHASRGTVRRFVPIMLVLAPATVGGSLLLARADGRLLAMLVGALALTFVVLSMLPVRLALRPDAERWLAPAVGLGGGLLQGASGISGPIVAIYVHALRLNPRDFAYGVTLLFTVGAFIQALSYLQLGLFTLQSLVPSLVFIPMAIAGQELGFRLQDRLEPRRFRQGVIVVVALSGANLLLRGLGMY